MVASRRDQAKRVQPVSPRRPGSPARRTGPNAGGRKVRLGPVGRHTGQADCRQRGTGRGVGAPRRPAGPAVAVGHRPRRPRTAAHSHRSVAADQRFERHARPSWPLLRPVGRGRDQRPRRIARPAGPGCRRGRRHVLRRLGPGRRTADRGRRRRRRDRHPSERRARNPRTENRPPGSLCLYADLRGRRLRARRILPGRNRLSAVGAGAALDEGASRHPALVPDRQRLPLAARRSPHGAPVARRTAGRPRRRPFGAVGNRGFRCHRRRDPRPSARCADRDTGRQRRRDLSTGPLPAPAWTTGSGAWAC